MGGTSHTESAPILVTGGTGTLGRPLVDRLVAQGAPVRVLSRRPRRGGTTRSEEPYEWAVGDLATGAGIDEAVTGVRAIVHCATTPRHDAAVTRRLLEAAERAARRGAGDGSGAEGGPEGGAAAGMPHFVYISIVGIDEIPFFYYRAKLAAERLVATSPLPWTVLRTTQFHDLVAGLVTAQRRLPAVLGPKGIRFQSVEVTEVAERLAELAQGAPAGRVPDMGGPEIRTFPDLAEATLRAAGRRRPVLPLPLPGKAARAARRGANLCPERGVGTVTFEEYLAARAKEGRL